MANLRGILFNNLSFRVGTTFGLHMILPADKIGQLPGAVRVIAYTVTRPEQSPTCNTPS